MRRSPPTTIGSRAVKADVSFSARSMSPRSPLSSSSRSRSIASATLIGLGRPRIGGIGVGETALGALAQIGQGAAAAKPRSISVSSDSAL